MASLIKDSYFDLIDRDQSKKIKCVYLGKFYDK